MRIGVSREQGRRAARGRAMSDMHKHCNDYVGEMRDRIAQLEAELAEARKQQKYAWERHAEKDRAYGEALAARDAERAAHARTHADLTQTQVAAYEAELELSRTQAEAATMRAVLVYARDQLEHLARAEGYDMTLLRKCIVKLLGDPAPEVGSTFADVLKVADDSKVGPCSYCSGSGRHCFWCKHVR